MKRHFFDIKLKHTLWSLDMVGYYSLDTDAYDKSIYSRDGFSKDVVFGINDAKKGTSAQFDGESYIRVSIYKKLYI